MRMKPGTLFVALYVFCIAIVHSMTPPPSAIIRQGGAATSPQGVTQNFGSQFPLPVGDRCFRAPKSRVQGANGVKSCATGYHLTGKLCWPECPVAYPVKCGPACLAQGKTCRGVATDFVVQLADGIANTASFGIFSAIKNAMKVYNTANCVVQTLRALDKSFALLTKNKGKQQDTLRDLLMIEDYLPAAIGTCTDAFSTISFLQTSLVGVQQLSTTAEAHFNATIKSWAQAIANVFSKNPTAPIRTPEELQAFVQQNKLNLGKSLEALTQDQRTIINNAVASQTATPTCAAEIRKAVESLVECGEEQLKINPRFTTENLFITMTSSSAYSSDIPKAADTCFQTAAERNDFTSALQILAEGIAHEIVQTQNKAFLRRVLITKIIGAGVDVFAYFVPPAKILQSIVKFKAICRPTVFSGTAMDGPIKERLGLQIADATFAGTTGEWTNAGDGKAVFSFTNPHDDTAKIHVSSGGYPIADLPDFKLQEGQSVIKRIDLAPLKGRVLYFELGACAADFGARSGTMLLWVPVVPSPGHLEMTIPVKPNEGLLKKCAKVVKAVVSAFSGNNSTHAALAHAA